MKLSDFLPDTDEVEFAEGFYAVYNASTHEFLAKVGLHEEGPDGEMEEVFFSDLPADCERFREPAVAAQTIQEFEDDDPEGIYQNMIVIRMESFYSFKPHGTKRPSKPKKPVAHADDTDGDETA